MARYKMAVVIDVNDDVDECEKRQRRLIEKYKDECKSVEHLVDKVCTEMELDSAFYTDFLADIRSRVDVGGAGNETTYEIVSFEKLAEV